MAVTGGKITLKVEADIEQLKRQLQAAGYEVKKLEGELKKSSKRITETGDQAAAAAVRFQTLTQGAINLTTAFVQTETTISNLTKAQTSLKAAMVGVDRANDLLRRKEVQLNEERKKAVPNMDKIKLLTREIATGYKDLEVKQDRVRDQTDQLNDTYKLFALNLLNVSFSAIQTGKAMVDSIPKLKAVLTTTNLLNVATSKWTVIALSVIAVWEGIAYAARQANLEWGKNLSIIGQVTQMMEKFTGASEVSFGKYDKEIAAITSSNEAFSNSFSGMTDTMKREVSTQERLAKKWSDAYQTTVANIQIELGKAKNAAKEMNEVVGATTNGNFSQAQTGVTIPSTAGHAVLGIPALVELWKKVEKLTEYVTPQTAYGELAIESNLQKRNDTGSAFLNGGIPFNRQRVDVPFKTGGTPVYEKYSSPSFDLITTVFGPVAGNIIKGSLQPQYQSRYLIEGTAKEKAYYTQPTVEYIKTTQAMNPNWMNPESLINKTQSELDAVNRQITQLESTLGAGELLGGNRNILLGQLMLRRIELENQIFETQEFKEIKKGFTPGTPILTEKQRIEKAILSFKEEFPAATNSLMKVRLGSRDNPQRQKFQQRRDKLHQLLEDQFFMGLTQPYVERPGTQDVFGRDRNVATFFGGFGGGMLTAEWAKKAGFGRDSLTVEKLLEYQGKDFIANGAKVPVPRRTNVDVSGFSLDNGVANAAQIATMGGVSILASMNLPPALQHLKSISQANINRGLVSVSEVQGGAARFAARNQAALRARRAEIAEEMAYLNSPEGVARIIERRMSEFGSDYYYERYAGPRAPITQRQAKAFQKMIYPPGYWERQEFIARTGFSDFASLPVDVVDMIGIVRSFAEPMRIGGQGRREYHLMKMAERHRAQNAFLRNAVNRFQAGNYGQFEATTLYGIRSETANVIGTELSSEQQIFQANYGTPLSMEFKTFATIMADAKRGINEVDDRLRWNQRLEQISTGATVF